MELSKATTLFNEARDKVRELSTKLFHAAESPTEYRKTKAELAAAESEAERVALLVKAAESEADAQHVRSVREQTARLFEQFDAEAKAACAAAEDIARLMGELDEAVATVLEHIESANVLRDKGAQNASTIGDRVISEVASRNVYAEAKAALLIAGRGMVRSRMAPGHIREWSVDLLPWPVTDGDLMHVLRGVHQLPHYVGGGYAAPWTDAEQVRAVKAGTFYAELRARNRAEANKLAELREKKNAEQREAFAADVAAWLAENKSEDLAHARIEVMRTQKYDAAVVL